jgi:hypothetical protein
MMHIIVVAGGEDSVIDDRLVHVGERERNV